MTMSGDMSIVLHDEINSVLGSEARAEWERRCLELEIAKPPEMEASLRALESAWLDFQASIIGCGESSRDRQTTGVRAYHARTNNGHVADTTQHATHNP